MRVFLISALFAILTSIPASACYLPKVERWYMFCFAADEFGDRFNSDNEAFWKAYTGVNYPGFDDYMEAARKKRDTEMTEYLAELKKYSDASNSINYSGWSYPTAAELNRYRNTMRQVASVAASRQHRSKYSDRWTLLLMRANMALGNYDDNITVWNNIGSRYPKSMIKEKMLNIYANALLNTGKKTEAWNIYAAQDDRESLVWSVRKHTNLAGIKRIFRDDPNAPVLSYLLQFYLSNMQDLVDWHTTFPDEEYEFQNYDEAYAQISKDYLSEMKQFVAFAHMAAANKNVTDKALWLSAASIAEYYMGDYHKAYADIKIATDMEAPENIHKMARRLRMFIAPSISDITTPEFKKFIVAELQWLDNDIKKTGFLYAKTARDRILNLALSRAYAKAGDMNTAAALQARNSMNWQSSYISSSHIYDMPAEYKYDINNDHSSESYEIIFSMPASKAAKYFALAKAPGSDPLLKYCFSGIQYSDDYVNDILGTMYLRDGDFNTALSYLDKVPLNYLSNQNISFYSARRDYTFPAWNCWQFLTIAGDYETPRTKLSKNVKADFCRDIIDLTDSYNNASGEERLQIAYDLAVRYYQASYKGQCWYITDYYNSSWWPADKRQPGDFVDIADKLLVEASASTDPMLKSRAMLGLIATVPDEWRTSEYDYDTWEYKEIIHPASRQYKVLTDINKYLLSTNSADIPSEVSRCDVIKQFRKFR